MKTPAVIEIPLTQGKVALVDASDWELIKDYKWRAMRRAAYTRGKKYFYGYVAVTKINRRDVYLHRLLMQPGPDLVVDHISGETLDNRRANLRVCTQKQNRANSCRVASNTSGYKGVSFNKEKSHWRASIRVNGHSFLIGSFACPIEAARAWDAVAREWWGEFARLNF